MLRSMYSGVSGMKGFQTKLDVIGNNIANVNTVGFKKGSVVFQDMLSQTVSSVGVNPAQVGLGSSAASIQQNHNPGSGMMTGVGTDLAIMGKGFFVVKDSNVSADGLPLPVTAPRKEYLTRTGNLVVDKIGYLKTPQGHHLLDTKGNEIQINPTAFDSFAIESNGTIKVKNKADGSEEILKYPNNDVVQIAIFAPPNPSGLRKSGGSLYEMTDAAGPGGILYTTPESNDTQIQSGMLEMSNVELTEEFTEMIIAQRGFQANSKIISTSDEILQELVNLKR
ncbi:flagellar hook-basal body complex protein [Chryseomicrobium palamuruense]|uniref:Flagellar hook protein FlgE n=1 Tax=Chryseomicrobium palamuruense TaxID=682973 RepID=A0ABV8UWC3_9BACL